MLAQRGKYCHNACMMPAEHLREKPKLDRVTDSTNLLQFERRNLKEAAFITSYGRKRKKIEYSVFKKRHVSMQE